MAFVDQQDPLQQQNQPPQQSPQQAPMSLSQGMPNMFEPSPLVTQGMAKLVEGQGAKYKEIFQKNEALRERDQTEAARVYGNIQVPDPPKWDAQSQAEKYRTSPFEVMGSFQFIAAMLAAAGSKRPALNAMNALASGMKAANEGDKQNYDRAFAAWKENNDLLMKRFQMEREHLGDALNLMKTDADAGRARVEETAAQFGMEKEAFLARNGYVKELFEMQEAKARTVEHMQRMQIEAEKLWFEKYQHEEGRRRFEADPRSKSPDAHEQMKAWVEAFKPEISYQAETRRDLLDKQLESRERIAQKKEEGLGARLSQKQDLQRELTESTENLKRELADKAQKNALDRIVENKAARLEIQSKGFEFKKAIADEIEDKRGTRAQRHDDALQAMAEARRESTERHQRIMEQLAADRNASTADHQRELDRYHEEQLKLRKESLHKLDPSIVNNLKDWEGVSPEDLAYISTPNQTKLSASFEQLRHIERVADSIKQHPEAVGLIADSLRRINLDQYQGLLQNPEAWKAAVDRDLDKAQDQLAKEKGYPVSQAAAAKLLNKQLTTLALNDAAQWGRGGGTIFLDKTFQNIYQQGSNVPTLLGILRERQVEANEHIKEYMPNRLGLENRKNLHEFPLFQLDVGGFIKTMGQETPRIWNGRKWRLKPGADPTKEENYEDIGAAK